MFCVIAGGAVDHSKCVTTAHPLDRQPAGMFSSVVVGVKELEAGRDALCLARALTSANGNLTLAHVQVVAPSPRRLGRGGGRADDAKVIFDNFISIDVVFRVWK